MCKFIVSGFLIVFILNVCDALHKRCNKQEDLLQRCAMALPVLSSKEISFALTRDELDKSCLELNSGIKCIDNYTSVCMDKREQEMFKKVYAGITGVIKDLCQRGPYQDKYLSHANCVKHVRSEYEQCSRKYEVTLTTLSDYHKTDQYQTDHDVATSPEDSLRTVCCSFQEYMACSARTVQAACGPEAAEFTSEFLKKMSSDIIKNFCSSYRGLECGIPDKATIADHSVIMISIAVFANVVAYMSDALVPT